MRGFYVPDQTEEEEAEIHENAPVENLADDDEIKGRKTITTRVSRSPSTADTYLY
jgi:hypothetical protein